MDAATIAKFSSAVWVGYKINKKGEKLPVSWSLSFLVTKDYPSIIGAPLDSQVPGILHGQWDEITRQVSFLFFLLSIHLN